MKEAKHYNSYVEGAIVEDFYRSFNAAYEKGGIHEERLRTCSASVGIVNDGSYIFIYLRSYNTIVAVIDNCTGEAVDMLRTVYGYTATSAQHIRKFLEDFPYWTRLYRTHIDNKGEHYYTITFK